MSAWNYLGLPCGQEVIKKGAESGLPRTPAGLLHPSIPNLSGLYMHVIQYISPFNLTQIEGVCLLKDSQYSTSSGTHFHLLPTGSPHVNLDASRGWST